MNTQLGSALIITLVILTVITLGALSAMRRSLLQHRVVGNMQYQQELFNHVQNELSDTHQKLKNGLVDGVAFSELVHSGTVGSAIVHNVNKPLSKMNNTVKEADIKIDESLKITKVEVKYTNNLKEVEGTSANIPVLFRYMEHLVVAKDSQNIKSSQQVGIYYRAPKKEE